MPKRVGYLYEKMLDKAYIKSIILKAAKGKHKRRAVRRVLDNLDEYVDRTYELIASDSFEPAEPKEREIYDVSSQKWRTIKTVPFWPDSIIHWLLTETMRPVLVRGLYAWSCASVPGRGGIRVKKYIEKALRQDPKGTKYALEIDVKAYYPSIPINRLIWALDRKIKDRRFVRLVYDVLYSCGGGLAIGYYICQWLANYYLEPLDNYMLSLPGVKHMTRYMDNITIFGPSKKKLHRARRQIAAYMTEKLGVTMKGNWQVYPTRKRMVSAVGCRFSRTHTILRKRNFLRFARQCRRVRKKQVAGLLIPYRQAAGLISRIGQLKHCNSHKIRVKYIDPIKIKNLKEVVRYESKRRLAAAGVYGGGTA